LKTNAQTIDCASAPCTAADPSHVRPGRPGRNSTAQVARWAAVVRGPAAVAVAGGATGGDSGGWSCR
jgi:hypothetical protein